jgi:DNA-binding CsgD family transcriptional regulator
MTDDKRQDFFDKLRDDLLRAVAAHRSLTDFQDARAGRDDSDDDAGHSRRRRGVYLPFDALTGKPERGDADLHPAFWTAMDALDSIQQNMADSKLTDSTLTEFLSEPGSWPGKDESIDDLRGRAAALEVERLRTAVLAAGVIGDIRGQNMETLGADYAITTINASLLQAAAPADKIAPMGRMLRNEKAAASTVDAAARAADTSKRLDGIRADMGAHDRRTAAEHKKQVNKIKFVAKKAAGLPLVEAELEACTDKQALMSKATKKELITKKKLTKRQTEIVYYQYAGLTVSEIAEKIKRKERTVYNELKEIRQKFANEGEMYAPPKGSRRRRADVAQDASWAGDVVQPEDIDD